MNQIMASNLSSNQSFYDDDDSNSNDSSDSFIIALKDVDYVVRVVSLLLFVIYFVLVLILRELRTKNLLYVHHANAIGFVFVLMYMVYFNATTPSTSNPSVNVSLCKLTEFIWGILKYLRSYSILLIALYRFVAVKYVNVFKRINKSHISIFLCPLLLNGSFQLDSS